MNKINRVVTIVLDSVGIGEAKDSAKFDDYGVNTLGNISKEVGLEVPNLEKLGLGNINSIKTVKNIENPIANYGFMNSKANGKDTLAGHWEMMGVTINDPFKTFLEDGLPKELINEFEKRTGKKVLGNKEANGMQIIDEYYDEHVKTGAYILYTSVDSTFQLAAREDIIPLEQLYKDCEIARELTKDPKYNIARVIARPFIGEKGNVTRTANRHDYALTPPKETVMQKLVKNNIDVIAVGKIKDIFNGTGVSKSISTLSNNDGVDKTIELLKGDEEGFIFTNLVDFDSKFGHSRDVLGYKNALEEFDKRIPEILEALNEDDLLIITADHGNDPTYEGNNHTREIVPLLVYNKTCKEIVRIEDRETFADLGETICEIFNIESTSTGKSFLKELK